MPWVNRPFEQSLEPLCQGEVWRIMRELEKQMDLHTVVCGNCIEVGCEKFNSMLIKHTACRRKIGIN